MYVSYILRTYNFKFMTEQFCQYNLLSTSMINIAWDNLGIISYHELLSYDLLLWKPHRLLMTSIVHGPGTQFSPSQLELV